MWVAVSAGVVLAALAMIGVVGRRQHRHAFGGRTIVRCKVGHLFTTIWIPGASFKAVRLGTSRFQHCPVGHHWTTVRPVDPAGLTGEERRAAGCHHDVPIP